MLNNKIFIEQEPQTGDFLMRMPADALPALYEMLLAAPLTSRRLFFQVKAHLEDCYNAPLAKAGLVKPKAQATAAVSAAAAVSEVSPSEEKEGGRPC